MASDILRVLADPIYVAKFQRACGVIYEKPEKIDQQTQTRTQPSDSDSSDHDERSQEISKGRSNGCTAVSSSHTDSESNSLWHQTTGKDVKTSETNNNVTKTSDNNTSNGSLRCKCTDDDPAAATKTKKINRKKVYHTIEPTSRIYSKGSIFECDADTQKSTNTSNGSVAGKNNRAPSQPAYKIKYRPLLYLAYFGAFLGNEEFYLTFFPFCIWNVDYLIVRQVGFCLFFRCFNPIPRCAKRFFSITVDM